MGDAVDMLIRSAADRLLGAAANSSATGAVKLAVLLWRQQSECAVINTVGTGPAYAAVHALTSQVIFLSFSK